MTEKINQINEQIKKCNNVLIYKEELYTHYQKRDKRYKAIYISTPKKGKTAFEQILKKLDNDAQTKNKTISKLIEEIIEQTRKQQLHIYLDHFEQMSNRELQNYKELEQQENICLIANIGEDKEFIDEDFLNKFIILNDEYYNNRSQSININYVLLLLISLLVFLLFLKIQLSMIRFIVSALWFTLLMYRSFYYLTR